MVVHKELGGGGSTLGTVVAGMAGGSTQGTAMARDSTQRTDMVQCCGEPLWANVLSRKVVQSRLASEYGRL